MDELKEDLGKAEEQILKILEDIEEKYQVRVWIKPDLQKSTLEAKRLRREAKQYDRGYPNFYEQPKEKPEVNPLQKAMRGFVMNHWFNLLGLTKETK